MAQQSSTTNATYEHYIIRRLREIARTREAGASARQLLYSLTMADGNLRVESAFAEADRAELFKSLVRACKDAVVDEWKHADGDGAAMDDAKIAYRMALAMNQVALALEFSISGADLADGDVPHVHPIQTGPLPGAYDGPEDDEPEYLVVGE